ncbi:accessory gene regulator ArgB-like protein [Natranaerobius trueperi]|uniref:Accessory regulator AgrB n=1 Tax=Natranaerobius trueperi TaxID=759412 RepID=A0A226C0S5_9FIRM|nr:accessory gene regulator B family protein [Natranaerobius trueperi]OWZ84863.1 hypothetical protein CDO51_00195 [Natranaerobius trueperi]
MFEEYIHKKFSALGNTIGQSEVAIEKATYGFLALIYTLINIIAVITVSYVLGVLYPALISLIAFALLRHYSGGIHSSHPLGCILISALAFPLLGKLSYFINSTFNGLNNSILILIFIISLLVISKKAPIDTPQKPIKSLDHKKRLKNSSILIVCLLFIFSLIIQNHSQITLISIQLGVIFQILMLPPINIRKQ